VLVWPDTFTNHFHPAVGRAAVEVLEHAGWRVTMPERAVCCGLTWISTGQLTTARRILRRSLAELAPALEKGTMVVGLEPSCTAVFRSDAHDLFPHDLDVQRLTKQTVTLAELLHEHSPGWRPPQLHRTALIQTHCHQHAVMGFDADEALLTAAGLDVDVLDSGCCGLAGNFGFEAGHYEVSEACADRVLLPALRDADPGAVVLADGFSCRTQIEQGDSGGRVAMHLAEVLAGAMRSQPPAVRPEDAYAERPAQPSALARAGALGAVAGVALATTTMGARLLRRSR
jgi:Fe-S oxidoreductase